LVIGLVAIWWQSTRTSQHGRSGTIIIPSNPAGDSANASPTEEALAKLEKLKGSLSDQIERRDFDDAASTISAILAIDRDNREALEAQAVIDRVKGTAVTREIDAPGNILAASFLPDGRRVIVGCSGVIGTGPTAHPEAIIGWDADTGQKLYDTAITGSTFRANCMAFSKDGRTALTGGYFGLNLYNVESGQKLNHFDAGVVSVACFLDGEKRALVGGSGVELWDLELNTVVRRYQGHTGEVQALALTPDGKRAVSAAADATIRLWDISKISAVWSAEGPKANSQSLALTPDGRYVLSGGDKIIRVLELNTGREVTRLKAHQGYTISLAVSPDGRRALSGGTDNIVRLWDLETAAQIRAYRVNGHWTGSVGFSPDSRRGLFGTAFGLHVVSLPD
jgi:WD40 repeat protein